MDILDMAIAAIFSVTFIAHAYLCSLAMKSNRWLVSEIRKANDEFDRGVEALKHPTGYTLRRDGFFVDIFKDGEVVDSCATASTARKRIRELQEKV